MSYSTERDARGASHGAGIYEGYEIYVVEVAAETASSRSENAMKRVVQVGAKPRFSGGIPRNRNGR
jgi:hypothetical protein